MKEITVEYLESIRACSHAIEWVRENQSKFNKNNLPYVIRKLIQLKQVDYANWLITRSMSKVQNVKYAIYAAEQVLHIYEKEHPNDKRPRKAMEAAKKWVNNPTEENINAAYAAAAAARARAANAAARAAYAAARAAAAAAASDAAAYAAAYGAARAAASDAAASAAAYGAAHEDLFETLIQIIFAEYENRG